MKEKKKTKQQTVAAQQATKKVTFPKIKETDKAADIVRKL